MANSPACAIFIYQKDSGFYKKHLTFVLHIFVRRFILSRKYFRIIQECFA